VATGELEALGSKIRESIDRRILSFLGILMKGNKVAAGRETIQKALRKHAVHLLLQAADADIRLSGTPGMEVPVRALFSRERFGQALGKAPQPLLGILDAKGSQALLKMIDMKKEIEQGGGE
jgi:ribosomal protein L7Ae-like RNA K-turn-binding protein